MVEKIKNYIGRKSLQCEQMICRYGKDKWEMGFADGYYWCLCDLISEIKEMENKESEKYGK